MTHKGTPTRDTATALHDIVTMALGVTEGQGLQAFGYLCMAAGCLLAKSRQRGAPEGDESRHFTDQELGAFFAKCTPADMRALLVGVGHVMTAHEHDEGWPDANHMEGQA